MTIPCPKCQAENVNGAEHCLQCSTPLGQSPSLLYKWLSPDYPKIFAIRDRAHQARVGKTLVLIVATIYISGIACGWLLFAPSSDAPEAEVSPAGNPTSLPAAAQAGTATPVPATGAPTLTVTPDPTNTPALTYTPVPTATPAPTATPVPTTPPGSVLLPGQTWYEDGLALTLNVSAITGDRLSIDTVIENLASGPPPIVSPVDASMVRLVANTGQMVTIMPRVLHSVRTGSGFTGATSMTLPQGEQFVLAHGAFFSFNLADPNVTSVTIEIVNLARIEKAAFRIDIPR